MSFVPEFTIADVADLLNIKRLDPGESNFNVICPFCGDKRGKMNFCVSKGSEIKNTYQCFECNHTGNMLTLYAELMGLSGQNRFKQAYREIKEQIGIGAGTKPSRVYSESVSAGKEADIASVEVRDQVYRAMVGYLTLKEKHKNDLRKRGLDDEQILWMADAGFKSTDRSDTELIARRLLSTGYRLKGVPGFFVNSKGNWDILFRKFNDGLLCPVILEGKIQGFQIRVDHVRNDRKYIWLSSAKEYKGASSGSPVGFYGDVDAEYAEVTEGFLKAAIAYLFSGVSFFAIGGVNQSAGLKNAIETYKQKHLSSIGECMDMDKFMNVSCDYDQGIKCFNCKGITRNGECQRKLEKRNQIQKGCVKVYQIAKSLNMHVVRRIWDRGENGIWQGNIKGIDDYWIHKKEEHNSGEKKKEQYIA